MTKLQHTFILAPLCMGLWFSSCKMLNPPGKKENTGMPDTFVGGRDSLNSGKLSWKTYFKDQDLRDLIDTALSHNQELNRMIQEIEIAKNEARARKGAYLPFIGVGLNSMVEKTPLYTSKGASDAANSILPGKPVPDPLHNYAGGFTMSWELDIWKKLRNTRKAALYRYFASTEGKNFMVTNLVSEIANAYYELLALDNQLAILQSNIDIQQNALDIVKLEKSAAKVTELAVRKFEAEVLKNQSRQFYIRQQIVETENRINYLLGRFPQPVKRNSQGFLTNPVDTVYAGVPSQLLLNRPDIRKAEQELAASKLDVKAARAEFYPSLMISAGSGLEAFHPAYLLRSPQSLAYHLAGDLLAPLVNRNALKAQLYSANARQIQAVYQYEQRILNAHVEVVNQLANLANLKKSFELKNKQVETLTQSIDISTTLFRSARADYMEVLMTQRDALDSKFELVDTKKQQLNALVNIYRALGGGWR